MTDADAQKITMPIALRVKLSAMMFLQFMMLPMWLNTIIPLREDASRGRVVNAQMFKSDSSRNPNSESN